MVEPRMKFSIKKIFIFVVVVFVVESILWACPCGCGAVGPLILSPGESYRTSFGVEREYHQDQVMANGKLGRDDSPKHSYVYSIGFGAAINDRLTLSLSVPYGVNQFPGMRNDHAVRDPSVGVRYQAYEPAGEHNHWIPQVQVHATYKYALSKGIIEEQSRRHSMDIHGNGLSELVPGVDLWFNHGSWLWGLGHTLIIKRSYEYFEGQEKKERIPGKELNQLITVGYTFFGKGQILASLQQNLKQKDQSQGKPLKDSDGLNHIWGFTFNKRVGIQKTLGFTVKQSAVLFANKNVGRTLSYGLNYSVTT